MKIVTYNRLVVD